MSEREQILCRIKENIQKIELFELIDDEYSELTIDHLKQENIKLKELLHNLNLKKEKGEIPVYN